MLNNQKIKFNLIIVFLVLFAAYPAMISGEVKKVTIFHINDLHAKIDNLGKIDSIVKEERSKNKCVLFLNAGDNFSGNPFVDQAEPKGEPVLQIFNKMGFDAFVIGNHEFDYDQKILNSFMKRAAFPIVCANFKVKGKGIPQPKPYVVIERAGLKIAVLGLIQLEESNGLPSTLPSKVRGIEFTKAVDMIDKYKYLKDKYDMVIALSHLGFGEDKKLAHKAGWLDLIVGGHSHSTIKRPHIENGVAIVQAGSYGKFLGKVVMTVDNKKVALESGTLLKISKYKKHSESIRALIKKYNSNPVLSRTITELPGVVEGKAALGSMVSDIIRDRFKLDMVFYNSGGIRIGKIGKTVKIKDVYAMHPFGNYIIELKLSYDEVADLIKSDYERHKDIDFLVSGLSYKVKVDDKERYVSVEIFDTQGKKISPDNKKKFKVGLTNYVLTSSKFRHEDQGVSTHIIVAEIVKEGIAKVKDVEKYSKINRTEKSYPESFSANEKRLPVALAGNDSFTGSSSAGNFAADAMRVVNKVDIAFYPSRLIKRDYIIPKGSAVKKNRLKELYRYCDRNKTVIGEMKGRDIRAFILKRFSHRNKSDVQVSGIQYHVRVNAGNHTATVKIDKNGSDLKDDSVYKVAFNDYDFDKYYNLDSVIKNKRVSSMSVMDIFISYFTEHGADKKSLKERRISIKKGA